MNEIEAILNRYTNQDRENLLPILQDVQREAGYLSEEAVVKVSNYLRIPSSKVYAVATFYDQFRFAPGAKHQVCVCNGTACHLEHSSDLLAAFAKSLGIAEGQASKNGLFSLKATQCMGACGMAPVAKINNSFYANIKTEMVEPLIDSILKNENAQ
jgi:NADH-quinone oxidoreductase subunit E